MKRNCNFCNIPFSLASRHQKMLALSISIDGENNFFGDGIKLFHNKHLKGIDIKETKWEELLQNNGIKTVHLAKKIPNCRKNLRN
jgi:hypothetical protein